MSFVLKQKYPDGSDCFYKQWTAIGPCATPKLEEAERFDTAQEAMRSPAFSHWASFYQPFELPADRSGEKGLR